MKLSIIKIPFHNDMMQIDIRLLSLIKVNVMVKELTNHLIYPNSIVTLQGTLIRFYICSRLDSIIQLMRPYNMNVECEHDLNRSNLQPKKGEILFI